MKRKIILLLIIISSLTILFTACAKEENEVYTVNSDFCIADISWGEASSVCDEKLGENFVLDDITGNIEAENVDFYGENTSIKFVFEQNHLNVIEIWFKESFDKQAVVDKISETWGERIEYYQSESGDKISAPEENHYWERNDGLVKASFQQDIESEAVILVIDATKLLVSLEVI